VAATIHHSVRASCGYFDGASHSLKSISRIGLVTALILLMMSTGGSGSSLMTSCGYFDGASHSLNSCGLLVDTLMGWSHSLFY
jgi:hypothetical protein